jgi:hypothetical protein
MMTDDKPKVLEFAVIRDTLDETAITLTNLLDRQFPVKLRHYAGFQPYFFASMLAARNICDAVRYLTADIPGDAGRKLEFGIAAVPMVRTLLDLLATLVFMREDLAGRVFWYHRGGWRELSERYDQHEAAYGQESSWQPWLQQFKKGLEGLRQGWSISEAEASEPAKLQYWPILGQIIRKRLCKNDETHSFLVYINDWFYRGLSAGAHGSAAGIVSLHGQLLLPRQDERLEQRMLKLKSNAVFTAITLFTAFCAEINSVCEFGQEPRLAYLWGILKEYWGEAADLYEKRYRKMLGQG